MNKTTMEQTKISFTPNPATDCVQVSGIEGVVKLIISDTHCRVLLTKEIVADEVVCLKGISRGVYIAKLITANGIERRKLEKK